MSISPRAQSDSVTTSRVRMQRPFPTPLPSTYYGTWSCVVVIVYSCSELGPRTVDGTFYAHLEPQASPLCVSVSWTRMRHTVICSGNLGHSPHRPTPPKGSSEPHSAGYLHVLILAKVAVSFLLLGGETEMDTRTRTPRRMANIIDNM